MDHFPTLRRREGPSGLLRFHSFWGIPSISSMSPSSGWSSGDDLPATDPLVKFWTNSTGRFVTSLRGKPTGRNTSMWKKNKPGWWFGCHQIYFPIYWVSIIIPIDELIFFRGVAQPPTRNHGFLWEDHLQMVLRPVGEHPRVGHQTANGWRLITIDIGFSFANLTIKNRDVSLMTEKH